MCSTGQINYINFILHVAVQYEITMCNLFFFIGSKYDNLWMMKL